MFNRIDVGPGPPLGPSVSLKLYITVDIRVSQEINRSTEAARSPWWKDVLKTEPEAAVVPLTTASVRNSYQVVHAYLDT